MRIAEIMLCLMILAPATCGCQALQGYRPMAIEVRDAETKAPIPGVRVQISYPVVDPLNPPRPAAGATAADGIVRLEAAPYGKPCVVVEAKANGYMSEAVDLSVDKVRAIEPAHFFENVNQRPVSLVVEMYTQPFPVVEFILPKDFVGQFKVETKIKKEIAQVPNQRTFTCLVPESPAVVQLVGPPLLSRVTHYRARYENGPALPGKEAFLENAKERPAPDAIAFWYLKSDNGYQFFLVGTRREYEDLQPIRNRGAGPAASSGGQKRGRHGHGNPSADPNAN